MQIPKTNTMKRFLMPLIALMASIATFAQQPAISDVRLYNLPVIAGKSYPVIGKGFLETDILEMTGEDNRPVTVAATLIPRGVTVALPADITSGIYTFSVKRGGQSQQLGKARLEVVKSMPKGAEIIAHRGHWNAEGSAQNSRASLKAAMDLEAYGSETDIWATTDNHMMVNHDRTFNGVTLCESTYDQCKDLTLPNGEKMPEFHELLAILKGAPANPTRLVIEVKDSGVKEIDDRAATLTLKEVDAVSMTGDPKITYISFSPDACNKIIELQPKAEVAFLSANPLTAMTPEQLRAAGYWGLDYEMGLYRSYPDWIKRAHDLGLTVNVWTVTAPNDIIEFMNHGVDFITTNDPEAALDIKAHFDAAQR